MGKLSEGNIILVIYPDINSLKKEIKKNFNELTNKELYIKFCLDKDSKVKITEVFSILKISNREELKKFLPTLMNYCVLNRNYSFVGEDYDMMIKLKF